MEKIKENRGYSLLAVAAIYAFAIAVGILIYRALPLEFYWSLLIADALATTVVYLFSVILKNASVYDPYWSVAPIVMVVYSAVTKGLNLYGLFLLLIICAWGVRLTFNWVYTFKNLKWQDWRYTMLKEKTGKAYPVVSYFGIHMFPTIVVYACMLPVCFAMKYGAVLDTPTDIFLILAIGAVVLQGVADFQMHRYRKNRQAPFMRSGLWKHSRHPNYLGEILLWWGIGISFVFSMPEHWYLIFGALVNNVMFLAVSIPMADKRQGKKDGFSEYKKETNMLIPVRLRNSGR